MNERVVSGLRGRGRGGERERERERERQLEQHLVAMNRVKGE